MGGSHSSSESDELDEALDPDDEFFQNLHPPHVEFECEELSPVDEEVDPEDEEDEEELPP